MARKVITLKGVPMINEEDVAADSADLIPGHLVEWDGSGDLIKQTSAVANQSVMVALERDELGKDIDVVYADGDVVKVGVFKPGERVYMWLASGNDVSKGDYLLGDASADGLLSKTGVLSTLRIAQALEAVDTSGSAPVAGTRIRVQVV